MLVKREQERCVLYPFKVALNSIYVCSAGPENFCMRLLVALIVEKEAYHVLSCENPYLKSPVMIHQRDTRTVKRDLLRLSQ